MGGCERDRNPVAPRHPEADSTNFSEPNDLGQAEFGFAVTSYDRCVAATGMILESDPPQCRYGGKTFVKDTSIGRKGDKKTLVWRIASSQRKCHGAHGPRHCLVTNFQLFFGAIDGFSFRPGIETIVEVERTQYCDPKDEGDCPADAGIYNYKLVRTIKSIAEDSKPGGEGIGHIVFRGTIASVEPGKDGYTVKVNDSDEDTLYVVLSIPNLGPDNELDFSEIQVGVEIEVEGEAFMLGDRRHMAAKRARIIP